MSPINVNFKGRFFRGLRLFIAYVICPLLMVIGPLVMMDELYACWRMSAVTTGNIATSEVRTESKTDGLSEAVLQYGYQVHGISYRGSRYGSCWLTPGKEEGPFLEAWFTTWHYPVGSEVAVHYDPDSPARCCLKKGLSHWSLGLTLITQATIIILLYKRYAWANRLAQNGSLSLILLAGLIILIIGPRVITLTWFLIILALLLVLSTPGWKLICRLFGWKPPVPLDLSQYNEPAPHQAPP